MDSGFIKSILISLAIALGVVIVVNVIGELSVRPRTELAAPERKQTEKAAEAPKTEAPAVPAEAPAQDIASLLAAYSPDAGSTAFRKCKSCHSSEKGGANRVGPNLWDVVGREKAAVPDFKYSDAMKLKGGTWTYRDLDLFLANPRTFVRGTKMSLKGFSDPVLRASMIGFLRALSDNPKPLTE
ncbi:MAG: cytochrome c family protein [Rhodospirillaceae bacterium]|nr:cytochrome c family protein [Rhodospirillaceae bacterium]MBL6941574.1 cytochrome c family protein [Rhodospirillales bacterium]